MAEANRSTLLSTTSSPGGDSWVIPLSANGIIRTNLRRNSLHFSCFSNLTGHFLTYNALNSPCTLSTVNSVPLLVASPVAALGPRFPLTARLTPPYIQILAKSTSPTVLPPPFLGLFASRLSSDGGGASLLQAVCAYYFAASLVPTLMPYHANSSRSDSATHSRARLRQGAAVAGRVAPSSLTHPAHFARTTAVHL